MQRWFCNWWFWVSASTLPWTQFTVSTLQLHITLWVKKIPVPEEYSIYDVKLSKLDDEHENIIMLPEVATKFAYKIKSAKIAIWWLSVDNYYRMKGDNLIKDNIKYYKDLFRLRLVPLMLWKIIFILYKVLMLESI